MALRVPTALTVRRRRSPRVPFRAQRRRSARALLPSSPRPSPPPTAPRESLPHSGAFSVWIPMQYLQRAVSPIPRPISSLGLQIELPGPEHRPRELQEPFNSSGTCRRNSSPIARLALRIASFISPTMITSCCGVLRFPLDQRSPDRGEPLPLGRLRSPITGPQEDVVLDATVFPYARNPPM